LKHNKNSFSLFLTKWLIVQLLYGVKKAGVQA
jgi:hypothetical protein